MKHLGDISRITKEDAVPVDCITFGSPCQDLSIAGKRAGLSGERSGLFMEAIRVIKEMYISTLGRYPKFTVWENVPGAFSSNKGEDFRAVLEELARIKEPEVSIPRHENGKWSKAGFICGNGWSIAWRTFDAQFWGVPQRRRRIAVVMDFGGQRAGEILFERAGMSRDLEPSIPPWKGIARNPADSSAGYDRVVEGENDCLTPWDVQSRRVYKAFGKWPAIYAGEGGGHGYVMQSKQEHMLFTAEPVTYPGVGITSKRNASNPKSGDPCHTLNTDSRNYVCALQGNMIDRDVKQNGSGISESETMFTMNATDRHGVCCLINDQGGQSINVEKGMVAHTLRAESHAHEPVIISCKTAPVVMNAPYQKNTGPLMANSHPGSYCGQDAYTDMFVTCKTVFESHSQDARYTQQGDTSPACTAQRGTGGNNMPLVTEKHGFQNTGVGWWNQSEVGATLRTPCGGDSTKANVIAELKSTVRWIVRRLTTTECERLQGYPDGWTDIGDWVDSKGKRHKTADSPRYKALGNSIALPQWWWLTCKMAKFLPEHATLGSLFDGIGGFPLVWETYHGKGTAIWGSEIEPFCIAVTTKRFGG